MTEGQASAELPLIIKGEVKVPYLLTGVRVEIDAKPHVVGMGIDISERKRAEARLAQVTAELAHVTRVGMLGELASALAHELNQPLTAILSNAQAARRFLDGGSADPAELRAILDDIVSEDKRAGEVIRRLGALLRKEPVTREACSLNDLVGQVLTITDSELVARNVAVRTDLEAGLPRVEVGRVEIQQVLINLLMNAAEAMKDTPSASRFVTVQTRRSETAIDITVRDRGRGIPTDLMTRVFDPFFTTRSSGLGMGLPISRRLIDAHGGRIECRNLSEGGAEFTLSLPVHAETTAPTPHPGPPADSGARAAAVEPAD
jgi:C4-dicarboxylate-specific signal transduction histidine kinase